VRVYVPLLEGGVATGAPVAGARQPPRDHKQPVASPAGTVIDYTSGQQAVRESQLEVMDMLRDVGAWSGGKPGRPGDAQPPAVGV
jgi:hypothetical protein